VLFHRPALACTSCHAIAGEGPAIGPDLAKAEPGTTPERLVEALLEPSKTIRRGYETVALSLADGRVATGLLVDRTETEIRYRDSARPTEILTIEAGEIDEVELGGPSLMPGGLVAALPDRRAFLDLTRYLIEIAEGGPDRAKELQPSASELAVPLPEYESHLDHAGLVGTLDQGSFDRGAAIYARVCQNCHGTPDREGSLPTSLKFWSAALKNGSDPLGIYRTLTHGYGQMPAQTWMVPRQKYDVVHYLREAYLKTNNPTQYTPIDAAYLASLPKGDTAGPEPAAVEPWVAMDYGPVLAATIEVGEGGRNIAYKGLAVRLDEGPGGVSRGTTWGLYEHDTMRLAAVWTGDGFIDWQSIHFDGAHGVHPRVVGQVLYQTPDGPGWADPASGRFDPDPRVVGRDDRRYGPLPHGWLRFRGRYQHGSRSVLHYTVGEAEVLDSLSLESQAPDQPARVRRTLNIGRSSRDLTMRIAEGAVDVGYIGGDGPRLAVRDGFTMLEVPASVTPIRLALVMGRAEEGRVPTPVEDLGEFTRGGPPLFPEPVPMPQVRGDESGSFAVDELVVPESNPWLALVRPTGFDFLDDGRAMAVCTWDGDVWRVDGLDQANGTLTWRRIATGLFQPLGLKRIGEALYVTCRDQIAILRDLDGDGFTDFHEAFNTDQQVTEHFHEFAMGLQVDDAGNLYYTKGARHAKTPVVPQHGTLLRVSPDGSRTDILATGFRAPNGVCLNPDGTYFVTDQEGHWIPKNRVNLVRPESFHGNMWSYTDVRDPSDDAMEQPLCWITNKFDRSPAEPIWVPGGVWGPLAGSLLNLSYGYGKVFAVPFETLDGQPQGGMVQLPIPPAPTGLIRARWAGQDLYACGMFAWAGSVTKAGGLYRIRYLGRPIGVPIGVKARPGELVLTFTEPLDRSQAVDATRYRFRAWGLRRSGNYGSEHIDEHLVEVAAASLSDDGRTVTLSIPDLEPTRCYELQFDVRDATGQPVRGALDGTIHRLGP
jgi:putative heme-binding domain-containing protein